MRVRPSTRAAAALAGWVALAVTVAAVSTFAVNALGTELGGPGGQRPLSAAEVTSRLLAPASTPGIPQTGAASDGGQLGTPTTGAPTPELPATSSNVRVSTTAGGTAVYRCAEDSVLIMSVTPAQGYSVAEPPESVPTEHARIRFESSTKRVDVDIRCSAGVPTVDVETGNR